VRVERYRPDHRDGFVTVVMTVLAEFGFSHDRVLDADLARPEAFYAAVWVALDVEQVVGSVAVRRVAGGDAAGEAELKRMYLLPGYRSSGWGRELLRQALSWARLERLEAVRLDTAPTMVAAQRFYEAAGFERCGSRTELGEEAVRCELLYRLAL
jgi:ribosomal protein S18 acetylase RimI-like enzyme